MKYCKALILQLEDSTLKRNLINYIGDKSASKDISGDESIKIDTWELESLVNPEKYDMRHKEIGKVNVKLD